MASEFKLANAGKLVFNDDADGTENEVTFTHSGINTSQVITLLVQVDINLIFQITSILQLNGTNVTSTAAELNILDGVTATAADLNIFRWCNINSSRIKYFRWCYSNHSRVKYFRWCNINSSRIKYFRWCYSNHSRIKYFRWCYINSRRIKFIRWFNCW